MNCRHCKSALSQPILDLGSSPPSNAYLSLTALSAPEQWYPLRLLVCETCWLVQTEDHADRGQLFDSDYAYFSSYSTSSNCDCINLTNSNSYRTLCRSTTAATAAFIV